MDWSWLEPAVNALFDVQAFKIVEQARAMSNLDMAAHIAHMAGVHALLAYVQGCPVMGYAWGGIGHALLAYVQG